jgi:pilus assembly protein CpaB
MNAVRIGILATAALAAIAVAFFVRQAMVSEAPVVVQVEQRPVTRVLVARQDMAVGDNVTAGDIQWQSWPEEALNPGYVVENSGKGVEDFVGSVVRSAISQGEPVSDRKLVQPGDAGFMAIVLSRGMRAVAVPISEETGAGGFILPNDRVDIIATYEAESESAFGSRLSFVARTLVENARVLAIDQTYGDGEDTVIGDTATLELTPEQARAVTLAVARGSISLVLRALGDGDGGAVLMSGGDSMPTSPSGFDAQNRPSVTLIRYGRSSNTAQSGEN